MSSDTRRRCSWATSAPEYVAYHDDEWGRPLHGDAGAVRAALAGGVPVRAVLADHPAQAAGLPGCVRRLRHRDGCGLRRRRRRATADRRRHRAQPGEDRGDDRQRPAHPRRGAGRSRPPALVVRAADGIRAGAPPRTSRPRPRSRSRWRKELSKRGFRFVGPTTAYALMQATGMVNDHVAPCWRAPRSARCAPLLPRLLR